MASAGRGVVGKRRDDAVGGEPLDQRNRARQLGREAEDPDSPAGRLLEAAVFGEVGRPDVRERVRAPRAGLGRDVGPLDVDPATPCRTTGSASTAAATARSDRSIRSAEPVVTVGQQSVTPADQSARTIAETSSGVTASALRSRPAKPLTWTSTRPGAIQRSFRRPGSDSIGLSYYRGEYGRSLAATSTASPVR